MDIFIIFIIAVIITTVIVVTALKPTKEEKSSKDYYQFMIDRDIAERKARQQFENERIERAIEMEVEKQFKLWKQWEQWEKETEGKDLYEKHMHPLRPQVHIWNPVAFAQLIYDEETMKFKDVKAEIKARLEKLKENHKNQK